MILVVYNNLFLTRQEGALKSYNPVACVIPSQNDVLAVKTNLCKKSYFIEKRQTIL